MSAFVCGLVANEVRDELVGARQIQKEFKAGWLLMAYLVYEYIIVVRTG